MNWSWTSEMKRLVTHEPASRNVSNCVATTTQDQCWKAKALDKVNTLSARAHGERVCVSDVSERYNHQPPTTTNSFTRTSTCARTQQKSVVPMGSNGHVETAKSIESKRISSTLQIQSEAHTHTSHITHHTSHITHTHHTHA